LSDAGRRFALLKLGCFARCNLVPIGESVLELMADEPIEDQAQPEFILNMVPQDTASLRQWNNCVGVQPCGKGSALLDVLELTALDIALMTSYPINREGPVAHPKDNFCTVPNSAGMFEDLNRLTWRDEQLKGVGTLVERENYLGRGRNLRFVFENLPRHSYLMPVKYKTA
jgi:hypothetical protein